VTLAPAWLAKAGRQACATGTLARGRGARLSAHQAALEWDSACKHRSTNTHRGTQYTIDTTEEKVGHPDTWSNQLIDMLGAALMTSVCGILVVSLMLIAVLYVGLSRRPAQVYTRVTGRLGRAELGKAMDLPEWA